MAGAGISDGMNGGGGPGEGVGRGVPPGITGTNRESAWGVAERVGAGVGVEPSTSGNSFIEAAVPRDSASELRETALITTTLAESKKMERKINLNNVLEERFPGTHCQRFSG